MAGEGKGLKHVELIGKMTLEEKAAFLSGKNEWQSGIFPVLVFHPSSVQMALTVSAGRRGQGTT